MRSSVLRFTIAGCVLASASLSLGARAAAAKTIVIPSNAAISYPPAPPSLPKGVGLDVLRAIPRSPDNSSYA